MSYLQRGFQPRSSALEVFQRLASSLNSSSGSSSNIRRPSICHRCFARQIRTRRTLSTVTEYRPHTLDPPQPPPRNTNIPDTSIAGPALDLNKDKPPQPGNRQQQSIPPDQSQEIERSPILKSLPESEAQRSKPDNNPPPATSSPLSPTASASKPIRPSRLRSRKAAISLTPAATSQLRQLLAQPDPKLIRVGVRNRGCSGLAYHLEYVDKPGTFDEAVEQDGVKVLIDSKALFSIIGSEMDWVEDKLNQRFVFRNPNIKEQCGCGESFMV